MHQALLIEDSPAMGRLIAAELLVDDVHVAVFETGAAGIEAAMRTVPDLILLDVTMPDADGFEICEVLQAQFETSQIPVIFISASGEPADRVRGLNSGASDYIVKPFDGDELRARVRVALRHRTKLAWESRRAMRDGLTGLWNRAYLNQRLEAEVAASRRYDRPLSLVMIDLDHFKQLNDRHGHAAGDDALCGAASLMQSICRREDVACRYGGEEFVIVCPGVDGAGAAMLAERYRAALESHSLTGAAAGVRVTCSLGIADLADGEDLLPRADAALYRAKRAGRNRYEMAAAAGELQPAFHAASV